MAFDLDHVYILNRQRAAPNVHTLNYWLLVCRVQVYAKVVGATSSENFLV